MDKEKVQTKRDAKDRAKTDSLMHGFDEPEKSSLFSMKLLIILAIAILLGLGTGFYFAGGTSNAISGEELTSKSDVKQGQTYGSDDTGTFKDTAEGSVVDGGVDGEGAFSLKREGGPSQTVAMTSSTVDLSLFIGKKVKVWGKTEKAQKAAWLMDVGRLEVL